VSWNNRTGGGEGTSIRKRQEGQKLSQQKKERKEGREGTLIPNEGWMSNRELRMPTSQTAERKELHFMELERGAYKRGNRQNVRSKSKHDTLVVPKKKKKLGNKG